MEKIETEITIKLTKSQICQIRNACIYMSNNESYGEEMRDDWKKLAKELTEVIEK